MHPHVEQSLHCKNCDWIVANNSLPLEVECLSDELGDSPQITQFKINKRRENRIPKTDNIVHSIICDVAIKLEREKGLIFSSNLRDLVRSIIEGKTYEGTEEKSTAAGVFIAARYVIAGFY